MKRYRLFPRSRVTKFVLFLVARVGSTYLTSVLSSHPNVAAGGEELRDLEKEGADTQLARTRQLLHAPLLGRKAAYGFNVKLVHLCDPARFADLLRSEGVKAIHMMRRNRVKSVVSRLNGERLHTRTGKWGLFDAKDRPEPLLVDLAKFDEYLRHREQMDSQLAAYVEALQLQTMTLCYEDLLRNEQGELGRLFEFLNVEALPVEGRTLKITGDNLRESLANYDEVRARYVGTAYEPMFEEVIVPQQT